MTLISAIITDAYRESNAIAAGAAPSANQSAEGLARLVSIIAGVFGFDAGERLQDWMVGYTHRQNPNLGWNSQDWTYPISNVRILLNHDAAQTLYLPERPENGARIGIIDVNGALAAHNVTLSGNGRLIDGQPTAVLSTNNLNKTWVYNDETADWSAITALTADSPLPFPPQFDDYFIISLAARLNPRYGRSLSDLSLARLTEVKEQLQARYRQTRTVPAPTAVRRLRGPSDRGFTVGGRGGRFGWMGS